MRQRTLGIIGAALIVVGVAVDVGSDIAARRFAPAATLVPAGGPAQVQLPRRHDDGFRPGGPHDRGPLIP